MRDYLASAAWKELADSYHLTLGPPPPDCVRMIPLSRLAEEAACREYVGWLAAHIGAPDLTVAASMLGKRIGYLLAAPALGAMSYHGQAIDFSLESCVLYHPAVPVAQGGTRFPFLALEGLRAEEQDGDREIWRERTVSELFAGRLTPVLKMLSAAGPVPLAVLWENMMVRIAPLYVPDETSSEADRLRLAGDFRYLAAEASGVPFGARRNPLAPFAEAAAGGNGLAAKSKRLTCCFYYRMSDEFCRKCPKIDNENESQLK